MTDDLLLEEPIVLPNGPFFRFADEAAWLDAARTAGFMTTVADEDGNETEQLAAYTKDYAIDVIGTITRGGEWDEDGNVVVPPTTLDGWHVNYLGSLPDGWEQFAVTPQNPARQWL
jgi:hypothetical protein